MEFLLEYCDWIIVIFECPDSNAVTVMMVLKNFFKPTTILEICYVAYLTHYISAVFGQF